MTTQTTLSQWDTQQLVAYIKATYPRAQVHIDICAATQKRQEAVANQARGAELTIVVGDPRSNNTNRLVQVSVSPESGLSLSPENLISAVQALLSCPAF